MPVSFPTLSPSALYNASGNSLAFLGDSITGGNPNNNPYVLGTTYPNFVFPYSQQKLQYIKNAGVPSQTSAQILSRVASDTLSLNPLPTHCAILAGTNDIVTVSVTTTEANIASMATQLRAAGVTPILCTIPPRGSSGSPGTTAQHNWVSQLNAWITGYARQQRFQCVDFYSLLVDPTSGNYQSAYGSDGTHPTATGYRLMGQLMANQLAPTVVGAAPFLTGGIEDSVNMLPSGTGLFLSGTSVANGTIPLNWTDASAGNSGRTFSLVSDSGIVGQWFRVVKSDTNGSVTLNSPNITNANFSAGDRLGFGFLFQSSGFEPSGGALTFVQFNTQGPGGSNCAPVYNWQNDFSSTVYCYCEYVVPTGPTGIVVSIALGNNGSAAGQGTGTIQVARMTLVNLTRLGFTSGF